MSEEEWAEKLDKAMELMYNKANEFEGKVSGEHAIGFAKKKYLQDLNKFTNLSIMKNMKMSLDVKNILNPGKIII